ncbi:TlpA family protein disulfide reductase [Salisediminibacterium beveridgei]|uniref:Cytochrome c-type biogenesis protein CcmG/DsbE, thiol:disulfide oxidoreductase n=1 Tax=Salisediminibacterium beveridgei TaxID=632773 RepID=A0A1D7QVP6_9BACI|nr:TlpA disulfide reductase family protein [Salisediminibacterium beveridgei]AOM83091.1 Cytochrome c-type biogenesis protein CcmG/DsbE, thiol:disulfide oxidoreductase [Salisediminibacterium beveridgei]
MIHLKRVMFIMMAIAAVFFLWLGNEQNRFESGNYTAAVYPQPGHIAPVFQAETFTGDTFSYSDNEGVPAVIYFWTSWCPYCKASSEAMEEAHQAFGEEVQFIGVNATASDQEADAQSFIEEHSLTFVNVLDDGGGIAGSYYVPPVPTTVFINADGVIEHRKTGGITANEIRTQVRLLQEGL